MSICPQQCLKLKQHLVSVLFTYRKANHLLEEISASLVMSVQP